MSRRRTPQPHLAAIRVASRTCSLDLASRLSVESWKPSCITRLTIELVDEPHLVIVVLTERDYDKFVRFLLRRVLDTIRESDDKSDEMFDAAIDFVVDNSDALVARSPHHYDMLVNALGNERAMSVAQRLLGKMFAVNLVTKQLECGRYCPMEVIIDDHHNTCTFV